MRISKLNPIGFCCGVDNAYQQIFKIINKHTDCKIYMIGWLVHNKQVIETIKKQGVIILDDCTNDKYQLINNLSSDKNKTVVIFSAHGTQKKVIDLANEKFKYVYNLICPYVSKTFTLIKKYNDLNYKIIYFGKKNHPEALAAKSLATNFVIIENYDQLQEVKDDSNIFFVPQTTVNYSEFESYKEYFKNFKHKIVISNEICDASRLRQNSISKISDYDVVILLGDKRSNNSKTLYELAKKNNNNVHFIESITDIDFSWFNKKNNCIIASATSCSAQMVDQIIDFVIKNTK